MAEPTFEYGLYDSPDGRYCRQGTGSRQDYKQDRLSLCRSETERPEGSPWHVGRQIGKFLFLDGCPDRLEGSWSAGYTDYLY